MLFSRRLSRGLTFRNVRVRRYNTILFFILGPLAHIYIPVEEIHLRILYKSFFFFSNSHIYNRIHFSKYRNPRQLTLLYFQQIRLQLFWDYSVRTPAVRTQVLYKQCTVFSNYTSLFYDTVFFIKRLQRNLTRVVVAGVRFTQMPNID